MMQLTVRTLAIPLFLILPACSGGGDGGTTEPPATGNITGTVSASGSGVGNASVALTGGGTQTTNASGQYTFSNVPVGTRTLTLTLPPDFELDTGESVEKSVSVQQNQTATVNWALRPTGPTTSQVDTVRLVGTSFEPQNLTIKEGGTVVWVNSSSTFHTVTPDGHTQWNSVNTSSTGEALRVKFNSEGLFNYFCEPHRSQGMTGRITVEK